MKPILTILLFFLVFETLGQLERTDKIELRPINSQDTLAKYAVFINEKYSVDDMKAHELVWGLKSVKKAAIGFHNMNVGMETFTIILERPTDKAPYFLIGLYERQTETLNKLMTYRVDSKSWRIEKKNDWETKWTSVKD